MDLNSVTQLRKQVNQALADYRAEAFRVQQEKAALREAEGRAEALQGALALAQEIAQQVQQEAHERVATLVSRALETVFDEPYTFKINFEQKRGRTEACLVFERDGLEVDPLTASGGGVVDVAAFALRVSSLILSQPPLRRFLAFDEPFRFVSAEYRPRLRALVQELAGDLGVQFLNVTHQAEFQIGKVITL